MKVIRNRFYDRQEGLHTAADKADEALARVHKHGHLLDLASRATGEGSSRNAYLAGRAGEMNRLHQRLRAGDGPEPSPPAWYHDGPDHAWTAMLQDRRAAREHRPSSGDAAGQLPHGRPLARTTSTPARAQTAAFAEQHDLHRASVAFPGGAHRMDVTTHETAHGHQRHVRLTTPDLTPAMRRVVMPSWRAFWRERQRSPPPPGPRALRTLHRWPPVPRRERPHRRLGAPPARRDQSPPHSPRPQAEERGARGASEGGTPEEARASAGRAHAPGSAGRSSPDSDREMPGPNGH